MGPCMCGDTQCPSCGPAQGYNAEFERVCDDLCEACPSLVDDESGCEALASMMRDRQNELVWGVFGWIDSLRFCRTSIAGARPPVIENMTAAQVTEYIVSKRNEWVE